jgi:hypothetical protein
LNFMMVSPVVDVAVGDASITLVHYKFSTYSLLAVSLAFLVKQVSPIEGRSIRLIVLRCRAEDHRSGRHSGSSSVIL